jgi:hypothetical protein
LCWVWASLFDDTDKKGVANPVSLMHELITEDPRNAERIWPYIGGEEVNNSPTHAHHRYVINFEDFSLSRGPSLPRWDECNEKERREFVRSGIVPADYLDPVAADWPRLLSILERNVRPLRDLDNRDSYRRYWWRFAERRGSLYVAIKHLDRVLVRSLTSTNFPCFVLKEPKFVFDQTLIVFTDRTFSSFVFLSSRTHEVWAQFFGATFKDDGRYNIESCFEPFPFPLNSHGRIEPIGKEYYEFRASLMIERNEGLTKIYNRFHDPEERSNAIGELRRLHDAMDRAVLDAYGWTDIRPTCEFELEWEEGEADSGRRRKKPWRYRWPEPVRDEVLARLLALNAQHAEGDRPAPCDL